MKKAQDVEVDGQELRSLLNKHTRADSKRNMETLLRAAMEVFTISGVDAPVREIASRANLGIGTLYRHFPQRSDLIIAVFQHEVDSCVDTAYTLLTHHEPGEAVALWLHRYASFIDTKRGLATALHSGDPAYDTLPAYFRERLLPALTMMLDRAVASGQIRSDVEPGDLLIAVARLCMQSQDEGPEYARRMVSLLVDGMRYGATQS